MSTNRRIISVWCEDVGEEGERRHVLSPGKGAWPVWLDEEEYVRSDYCKPVAPLSPEWVEELFPDESVRFDPTVRVEYNPNPDPPVVRRHDTQAASKRGRRGRRGSKKSKLQAMRDRIAQLEAELEE